jgi:DNA invertase Pin-like site-specific DNA recombinase
VRIAVDAVDTSTPSGRLLTHVLALVAAFEDLGCL